MGLGILLMTIQIEIFAHAHRVNHQIAILVIDDLTQRRIMVIHRLGDLLADCHLFEIHLARKALGTQDVIHTGRQSISLEHVKQLLDNEVSNLFLLRMAVLDVSPFLKLLTRPTRRAGIHIAPPFTLIQPHVLLVLMMAIQLDVDLA